MFGHPQYSVIIQQTIVEQSSIQIGQSSLQLLISIVSQITRGPQ